ncbi:helix-turn-helix domain-containing protein [Streptomyces sp. BI20]|uniref:helix-turn-helix domain-containing protein n=1 Tax=Streptomyces sp. BI20 TaxID=3403460 RepID=UPI003C78AF25
MLEDREAIGRRVKRARLHLGLAQADLAESLGKTQGWLSKVERGRIEIDRVTVLSRLAAELHVHVNDLLERPYAATPSENQWRIAASAIMREMRRFDLTPVFPGTPRTSQAQWADTVRLHRLRDAAANTAILTALPDILREARALAEVATGHEREEGFAIYAVACKFAHTAAHSLGHAELIAMTAERARWAADLSGDPVLPAVATWMRVWDMWATADWDDALALSDRALASVQDDCDRGAPLALRAWGSLQLRAAISAARADRRAEADSRIQMAQDAAARLSTIVPSFDRHSLTFSEGNVAVHAISTHVEMHQQAKALAIHKETPKALIDDLPRSRQGHHHMDLARAHAWDGRRDKALKELETAEKLAPQLVRNHPIARATLRGLIDRNRSMGERTRRMSDRFHLDH